MSVKCIVYASKVPARKSGVIVPVGLSDIFRISKKMNKANKITGMLAYSKGRYLQIIEGEENSVDQLFKNIRADKRHDDVQLIFSVRKTQRVFLDWNARISGALNSDAKFSAFLKKYHAFFDALTIDKKQLIAPFMSSVKSLSITKELETKYLKLKEWPDFTFIEQSAEVFELCTKLSSEPQHYSDIINCSHLGSSSDIEKRLLILHKIGALEILPYMKRVVSYSQPEQKEKKDKASTITSSLYLKVKRFIGIGAV